MIRTFILCRLSFDIIQIFRANGVCSPLGHDAVADRRENDLHDELCHSAGQRAGAALQYAPAETVPENRRKADKNDDRKDEIVPELADEGRNIGLHLIDKLIVRVMLHRAADHPVQHIARKDFQSVPWIIPLPYNHFFHCYMHTTNIYSIIEYSFSI